MTLIEIQELIEAWETKNSEPDITMENRIALIADRVDSLAQISTQISPVPNLDPQHNHDQTADLLAEILWSVSDVANASKIDLTTAFIDIFEKKAAAVKKN